MSVIPIDRRFRGSVRLVKLHLWRVGKTTDLSKCFEIAKKMRMINEADESFITECLLADDRLEDGDDPQIEITKDTVDKLQHCAILLNAADPA